MLVFDSDYTDGAHPLVLKALVDSNKEILGTYTLDKYCKEASKKIKKACNKKNAKIYFTVGGTQTNSIVIGSILKSYQGVISVNTGHINLHEAGAIEHDGHKVLALEGKDGKLEANVLKTYLEGFYQDESFEHMVFPGLVYISHPTEYGTLYSKEELSAIKQVCNEYHLPLFIDGARLAYALGVENSLSLADIANSCDVFYIGGTKCGALCGEAIVFTNTKLCDHFFTCIKQKGALLAKGRLLGVQFNALFTDNLYINIGKQSVLKAKLLKDGLKAKGYKFFIDSPTNLIFVIVKNTKIEEIKDKISFSVWQEYDSEHKVIRLATSHGTRVDAIDAALKLL